MRKKRGLVVEPSELGAKVEPRRPVTAFRDVPGDVGSRGCDYPTRPRPPSRRPTSNSFSRFARPVSYFVFAVTMLVIMKSLEQSDGKHYRIEKNYLELGQYSKCSIGPTRHTRTTKIAASPKGRNP
eukprot:4864645-Prymnesium_polylepis.1